MKHILRFFVLSSFLIISTCSTPPAPAAMQTPQPTQIPTIRPSATPISIQYVTLGSPFAPGCGDGIPVIWAMNSFNGPEGKVIPGGAGHSDILAPTGCDLSKFVGEIVMPIKGSIRLYKKDDGGNHYNISLEPGSYLSGTIESLKFAGINNPVLEKVESILIRIGHVDVMTGTFEKGTVIGDMVYDPTVPKNPYKVAWEIRVNYSGKQYNLSPILFKNETSYTCPPVNNGCEPIPLFYSTR